MRKFLDKTGKIIFLLEEMVQENKVKKEDEDSIQTIINELKMGKINIMHLYKKDKGYIDDEKIQPYLIVAFEELNKRVWRNE